MTHLWRSTNDPHEGLALEYTLNVGRIERKVTARPIQYRRRALCSQRPYRLKDTRYDSMRLIEDTKLSHLEERPDLRIEGSALGVRW